MLHFAAEEGLPRDGCETVSGVPGHARIILGLAGQCNCHFRRRFGNLKLSVFEGSLARKLRFHIFNFQFLRAFSHKSFVFASSTSKASFSHQYTAPFEGSFARKLRFYISSISLFYGSLARKLRFHELKLQGCGIMNFRCFFSFLALFIFLYISF